MNWYVLDTNVVACASTFDPRSGFSGTDHVPVDELETVFEWLSEFRRDDEAGLVLDTEREIWREYTDALSTQDFGRLVVREKWSDARFHAIVVEDGAAVLPDELADIIDDRDDRKFVAVAIEEDGGQIVNATDPGWCDWQSDLEDEGVEVLQLIEEWLC